MKRSLGAILALGWVFVVLGAQADTLAPAWVTAEELGAQMCARWDQRQFVGCRPSAGECRYSCAGRDGLSLEDETGWVCDGSFEERVVCCCPG